jgi:hypothetical protein
MKVGPPAKKISPPDKGEPPVKQLLQWWTHSERGHEIPNVYTSNIGTSPHEKQLLRTVEHVIQQMQKYSSLSSTPPSGHDAPAKRVVIGAPPVANNPAENLCPRMIKTAGREWHPETQEEITARVQLMESLYTTVKEALAREGHRVHPLILRRVAEFAVLWGVFLYNPRQIKELDPKPLLDALAKSSSAHSIGKMFCQYIIQGFDAAKRMSENPTSSVSPVIQVNDPIYGPNVRMNVIMGVNTYRDLFDERAKISHDKLVSRMLQVYNERRIAAGKTPLEGADLRSMERNFYRAYGMGQRMAKIYTGNPDTSLAFPIHWRHDPKAIARYYLGKAPMTEGRVLQALMANVIWLDTLTPGRPVKELIQSAWKLTLEQYGEQYKKQPFAAGTVRRMQAQVAETITVMRHVGGRMADVSSKLPPDLLKKVVMESSADVYIPLTDSKTPNTEIVPTHELTPVDKEEAAAIRRWSWARVVEAGQYIRDEDHNRSVTRVTPRSTQDALATRVVIAEQPEKPYCVAAAMRGEPTLAVLFRRNNPLADDVARYRELISQDLTVPGEQLGKELAVHMKAHGASSSITRKCAKAIGNATVTHLDAIRALRAGGQYNYVTAALLRRALRKIYLTQALNLATQNAARLYNELKRKVANNKSSMPRDVQKVVAKYPTLPEGEVTMETVEACMTTAKDFSAPKEFAHKLSKRELSNTAGVNLYIGVSTRIATMRSYFTVSKELTRKIEQVDLQLKSAKQITAEVKKTPIDETAARRAHERRKIWVGSPHEQDIHEQ